MVMTTRSSFGVGKWLIKSCNDTYGFVCHKNISEFLPLLFKKGLKKEYLKFRMVEKSFYLTTLLKYCTGRNSSCSPYFWFTI